MLSGKHPALNWPIDTCKAVSGGANGGNAWDDVKEYEKNGPISKLVIKGDWRDGIWSVQAKYVQYHISTNRVFHHVTDSNLPLLL